MKSFLLLLSFVFSTLMVIAQDSESIIILPFDQEKYKQLWDKDDLLFQDSILAPIDSQSSELKQPNDIQVIPVPENGMAQMPNMSFKKDVHYTMRIKWYGLAYPYAPKIPQAPADSVKSSDGLFTPLFFPKKIE